MLRRKVLCLWNSVASKDMEESNKKLKLLKDQVLQLIDEVN